MGDFVNPKSTENRPLNNFGNVPPNRIYKFRFFKSKPLTLKDYLNVGMYGVLVYLISTRMEQMKKGYHIE